MTTTTLLVSSHDKERLERKIEQVLIDAEVDKSEPELEYVQQLAGELAKAKVVAPEEMPPDVVTMNSTVKLEDPESGRELTYTLSFPAHAEPTEGRISILAPVGIALLGCREGDEVAWPVPKGMCRYRIKQVVYQPEANDEYSK